MTLLDFNNMIGSGIRELFVVDVGHPFGMLYRHNIDTLIDEDYLDFAEFDLLDNLMELQGTVDHNKNEWNWDGNGSPRTFQGNTILKIKAW